MGNSSTRRSELGSVRETRPGRWQARITRGTRIDGKPRTVSKTFGSESEAWDWIATMHVRMDGDGTALRGITVGTIWKAYESERRGKLANSTLDRYAGCMSRHILPAVGDVDASRLSVSAVQSMIDGIDGRTEAKHCKAALSSILTWSVRHDILMENPIRSAHFAYPGDEGHEWHDEGAFNDDPFAAIEGSRDVWGAQTVMKAFPLMHGLPLEPVWLAMVGGGLRMEEAFALRGMDVRRIVVNGQSVTQVAVHHAENAQDGRHRTKNRRSVRIVALLEPFGDRMWELASGVARDARVCSVSPNNQSRTWRKLFDTLPSDPEKRKHVPKKNGFVHKGTLYDLPYIPLSRMRATHETLMQEAGVLDSINAAMHGHSQQVSYSNYQRADVTEAARKASEYLRVVS